MDGSEYSLEFLNNDSDDNKFDDESMDSILYYHGLGLDNYEDKDAYDYYTHLSLYDKEAIKRCGLKIEQVVDISDIGDKLKDLEILREKENLKQNIMQEVEKMKKPTEFDIYTLIQFQYEKVPQKYEKKIKNKKKRKKKIIRNSKKIKQMYRSMHFPKAKLTSFISATSSTRSNISSQSKGIGTTYN
jgi:hypothetical protein